MPWPANPLWGRVWQGQGQQAQQGQQSNALTNVYYQNMGLGTQTATMTNWCNTYTATAASTFVTNTIFNQQGAHWLTGTCDAEPPPRRIITAPAVMRHRDRDHVQRALQQAHRPVEADPERVAALARAEALLLEFLSGKERREFTRRGTITIAARSGRRYRINRGHVANIDVLGRRGGIVQHRLCVHPPSHLPIGDILLAQLLHLRDGDEDALLRIANVHPAPVLAA